MRRAMPYVSLSLCAAAMIVACATSHQPLTAVRPVVLRGDAPHLDITVKPAVCFVPCTVEAVAVLRGGPLGHSWFCPSETWQYSDGTAPSSRLVDGCQDVEAQRVFPDEGPKVHQYTAPGEYAITLTLFSQFTQRQLIVGHAYVRVEKRS